MRGRNGQCGLEFDTSGGDAFLLPSHAPKRKEKLRSHACSIFGACGKKFQCFRLCPACLLEEPRLEDKRVDALIGEGRTADVLRNLCARVAGFRKR